MTDKDDKDMHYLSGLVSSSAATRRGAGGDMLVHKLLYLILEEAVATRKRTEQTNTLLEEISDSLKKSTYSLERLAQATCNRGPGWQDVCLRTTKY
jgi:hypothetical protein